MAAGGWESVASRVRALKQSGKYTWLDAFGLIDNDGRDAGEQTLYARDGIFCVDAPTIENILLSKEVLFIMAQQHFSLYGGLDVNIRMNSAKHELSKLLVKHKSDIVYKKSLWKINRLVSEQKISLRDLFIKKSSIEAIQFYPIVASEYAIFENAIDHDDPFTILSRVPVKNTTIPGKLAKSIGYESFSALKQATMKKLDDGGPIGDSIILALKSKLPTLPTK